jgi:glycosyltransferase involved in cell wall biosynthesis
LTVPVGDRSALAAAFVRLLTDDELRRRLAAGARARFTEEYGPERFRAQILDLYDRQTRGGVRADPYDHRS